MRVSGLLAMMQIIVARRITPAKTVAHVCMAVRGFKKLQYW